VNKEEILQQYPKKRLSPEDGMAVTASVWEEAHDEHRLTQRLHTLLERGPGIVTGLEVVASDPPDTSVYVLPGIAISPDGDTIVIQDPVTYDLRAAQGAVKLLLTYTESKPKPEKNAEGELLRYVHAQFGLEAVALETNASAGVELARVYLTEHGVVLQNATRQKSPADNEIDVRFRHEIGASASTPLTIAICSLDDTVPTCHEPGIQATIRFLHQSAHQPVWVDVNVPLSGRLQQYPLVVLAAPGEFTLPVEKMNALYAYMQNGGTLLLESCNQNGNSEAALTAFQSLLESLGVAFTPLPEDHTLLQEPHLFATPPIGATGREPQIWIGEGVILSAADYGCLWAGHSHDGQPSREQIRTAHEWGVNLLTYANSKRR